VPHLPARAVRESNDPGGRTPGRSGMEDAAEPGHQNPGLFQSASLSENTFAGCQRPGE